MCDKKNSLLGNNDESRRYLFKFPGGSVQACVWLVPGAQLVWTWSQISVLSLCCWCSYNFLVSPFPWVGLPPQYILNPPTIDVAPSAILDITLVNWKVPSGAGFALQSFSAVHPNSALFYDKNSYNCIFTRVLLTYCEMCWQWCIKLKNSWK